MGLTAISLSLLLLAQVQQATSHTSAICTMTSVTYPGYVSILIGTYHSAGTTVDAGGYALLGPVTSPPEIGYFDGVVNCNAGTSLNTAGYRAALMGCSGAANKRFYSDDVCGYYTGDGQTICEQQDYVTGEKCRWISSKCQSYKPYLPADGHFQCYKQDPDPTRAATSTKTYNIPSSATDNDLNCFKSRGAVLSWHFIAIEGASSGQFTFGWRNTGVALDQGGNAIPCTTITTAGKLNYFEITIFQGESKCASAPTVSDTGADTSGLASCAGAEDGFLCNVRCTSGEKTIGELKCENGNWRDTILCTNKQLCQQPKLSMIESITLGTIPDKTATLSLLGAGCGVDTPAGTVCDFGCDAGYYKDGEQKLTCNTNSGEYGTWRMDEGAVCRPCNLVEGANPIVKLLCTVSFDQRIDKKRTPATVNLCNTGFLQPGIPGVQPETCGTRLPTGSPTAPTKSPTTKIPTTLAPTKTPTTKVPTTKVPTTKIPTASPTTKVPTTKVPTTKVPTGSPTTKVPTTKTPTLRPTTSRPTSTRSPTDAPTVVPTVSPTRPKLPDGLQYPCTQTICFKGTCNDIYDTNLADWWNKMDKECVCDEGWFGTECDMEADACILTARDPPCDNEGVCINLAGQGDYQCKCSGLFKGRYCDQTPENEMNLNGPNLIGSCQALTISLEGILYGDTKVVWGLANSGYVLEGAGGPLATNGETVVKGTVTDAHELVVAHDQMTAGVRYKFFANVTRKYLGKTKTYESLFWTVKRLAKEIPNVALEPLSPIFTTDKPLGYTLVTVDCDGRKVTVAGDAVGDSATRRLTNDRRELASIVDVQWKQFTGPDVVSDPKTKKNKERLMVPANLLEAETSYGFGATIDFGEYVIEITGPLSTVLPGRITLDVVGGSSQVTPIDEDKLIQIRLPGFIGTPVEDIPVQWECLAAESKPCVFPGSCFNDRVYKGDDILVDASLKTPDMCQVLCALTDDCAFFTFLYTGDDKGCYLKNADANTDVEDEKTACALDGELNCISGPRVCEQGSIEWSQPNLLIPNGTFADGDRFSFIATIFPGDPTRETSSVPISLIGITVPFGAFPGPILTSNASVLYTVNLGAPLHIQVKAEAGDAGNRTAGDIFCAWKDRSQNLNLASPEALRSESKDTCDMFLNGGDQFKAGTNYIFLVQATDTKKPTDMVGGVSFMEFQVVVNAGPTGGKCVVDPPAGMSGDTEFGVQCSNWTDAQMPIMYKFEYITDGQLNPISFDDRSFNGFSDKTILPPGNVILITTITDSLGAETTTETAIEVEPPSPEVLAKMKQDMLNELALGNSDEALKKVAIVAENEKLTSANDMDLLMSLVEMVGKVELGKLLGSINAFEFDPPVSDEIAEIIYAFIEKCNEQLEIQSYDANARCITELEQLFDIAYQHVNPCWREKRCTSLFLETIVAANTPAAPGQKALGMNTAFASGSGQVVSQSIPFKHEQPGSNTDIPADAFGTAPNIKVYTTHNTGQVFNCYPKGLTSKLTVEPASALGEARFTSIEIEANKNKMVADLPEDPDWCNGWDQIHRDYECYFKNSSGMWTKGSDVGIQSSTKNDEVTGNRVLTCKMKKVPGTEFAARLYEFTRKVEANMKKCTTTSYGFSENPLLWMFAGFYMVLAGVSFKTQASYQEGVRKYNMKGSKWVKLSLVGVVISCFFRIALIIVTFIFLQNFTLQENGETVFVLLQIPVFCFIGVWCLSQAELPLARKRDFLYPMYGSNGLILVAGVIGLAGGEIGRIVFNFVQLVACLALCILFTVREKQVVTELEVLIEQKRKDKADDQDALKELDYTAEMEKKDHLKAKIINFTQFSLAFVCTIDAVTGEALITDPLGFPNHPAILIFYYCFECVSIGLLIWRMVVIVKHLKAKARRFHFKKRRAKKKLKGLLRMKRGLGGGLRGALGGRSAPVNPTSGNKTSGGQQTGDAAAGNGTVDGKKPTRNGAIPKRTGTRMLGRVKTKIGGSPTITRDPQSPINVANLALNVKADNEFD